MSLKLLHEPETEDPILSVVNLIDIFLVIIAALLITVAQNPLINPFNKQDVTVITDPGKPTMEVMIKKGEKIEKYKANGNIGSGDGEKAGVAYQHEGRLDGLCAGRQTDFEQLFILQQLCQWLWVFQLLQLKNEGFLRQRKLQHMWPLALCAGDKCRPGFGIEAGHAGSQDFRRCCCEFSRTAHHYDLRQGQPGKGRQQAGFGFGGGDCLHRAGVVSAAMKLHYREM
jgi:hypothetical protein